MLLSMVGAEALAHDIEVKNADGVTIYYYWTNNNTELAVTHKEDASSESLNEYSGNVVIPESVTYNGRNYPVTSIGGGAFKNCYSLKNVIIPNSVTNIGVNAFYGCTGLTSVTIPNSVTNIKMSAFHGCSGLTSVTIGNSVTNIDSQAFRDCSGLTSITIPNSVTKIGNKAFSECTGLTSVTCQSSTPPTLGDGGFSDYTISLYVPKGSVLKYKAADNWRNFVIIREISEEQDVYLSILQMNGSIKLKVDADKPYFNLQIKADEGWKIHSVSLNDYDVTAEVASDGSYTTPVISSNSTLNVVFEKGSSNIANMTESQMRVNAYGNVIRISGAETGEKIAVYSADGKIVKSVKTEHGTATIVLPENQTYIVKGRQKTVKVRL